MEQASIGAATSTSVRNRALALATIRAGIGAASIFAPGLSAAVAGHPAAHDNPTARMTARLFGVRELLLAWLVVDAARSDALTPGVLALQSAVDASDVAVQSWSLIKRDGIDRGAAGGTVVAAGAAVLWARLARQAAR